jgi:hypothetical protein
VSSSTNVASTGPRARRSAWGPTVEADDLAGADGDCAAPGRPVIHIAGVGRWSSPEMRPSRVYGRRRRQRDEQVATDLEHARREARLRDIEVRVPSQAMTCRC